MDGQVCVEEAKADITDLKHVLAVSESENKSLKKEQTIASGRISVQHRESYSILTKLIDKNQKRLLRLTELEDTLTKQLLKVCAELTAVNDDISKIELNNEHKKHRAKSQLSKFGTPYFRHKESRPADNSDVLLLRQIGDIGYVDLPKPQSWLESEKKCLVRAIETEERNRQMKDIEIEKLKIKKKMQTCDESERLELQSELDRLKEQSCVMKCTGGIQLFQNSPCKYDWFKISIVDLKGKHSPQECQAMWTHYLHPAVNKGRWKKEEDEALKILVKKYAFSNWDTIALELNTSRSAFQCMCHFQNRLNPLLMRNMWDENDDYTLTVLIKSFRKGDYIPWKKIAYCFSNCSVSNVVSRWKTINPDAVKGKFSEAEDVVLVAAVRKFGKDFKKISDHFPGRTSAQLQERYKSFLKNERDAQPWSPDEDRLIWEKVKEFGHNFSHIATFLMNRNRTQIRHRYYRMLDWLKKHPGEEYPACRSGQFKIAEGPDELWKKVVNVMKDKKVKFSEVNGDALMDDDSFSSLKSKLKLRKRSGVRPGHQRTFHDVDLELANYFCCVYPQSGGRHKINYTNEEIDTHARATSKFLDFLCADLKSVPDSEIENDQMLSRLDKLVLKRMNVNEDENSSAMQGSAGASVSAERTENDSENGTLSACRICNIKHGERSYVNVWHNAVPPNQTSLIGIRSIMLWRNVLQAMISPPKIKTEDTFEECDQHERIQVSEGSCGADADEECSECIKEAKAVFEKHSGIWKSRFQSVFAWAALCSEFAPMSEDTCCLDAEFSEISLGNKGELMDDLETTESNVNVGRKQKKKIKLK
ncbi:uncharacterized protein LOC124775347 [Schistocerca piceifrons]|uniref:uncharacterized protein LOC124775347 n=1 Tax=Schistocerca piceifrons TaxID=274613 RepID=UPI001F5F96FC|nr:uncharacterized protein LOC124775347 [Schistocerca piceifrons]